MASDAKDNSELEGLVITVLGKVGAGKTTLLNNLLQIDDKPLLSPDKGTTKIELKTSKSGNILGIDVPGLEPSNQQEQKKVLFDLIKFGEGKVDLILLCIPVNPSNKFDKVTQEIMKSMQDTLGKKVWENCIVVFTFSNVDVEREDAELIQIIEQYTDRFRKELDKKLKVKDVEVKSIFEYKSDHDNKPKTIVTIPAGKNKKDRVNPESSQPWIDNIFDLIKAKRPEAKFELVEYHEYRQQKRRELVRVVAVTAIGAIAWAVWMYNGLPGVIGSVGGILVGGIMMFGLWRSVSFV